MKIERPETQLAYDRAAPEERFLIMHYVECGWDHEWPWTAKPDWLIKKYEILAKIMKALTEV